MATAQQKKRPSASKKKSAVVTSEATARQRRRYRYLLSQSDLFAHFIRAKSTHNTRALLAALMKKSGTTNKKNSGSTASAVDHRHNHHEESEEDGDVADRDLFEDEVDEEEILPFIFTESPAFITGGKMRPYQVDGLNWLINLYEHDVNGILADEMVQFIDKTDQSHSFILGCRDWERPCRR